MRQWILNSIILLILVQNMWAKNVIFQDSMNKKEGWITSAHDKGSSSKIKLDKGDVDKAVFMDFDLGDGNWVILSKQMKKNFSGLSKIKFSYYYKHEKGLNNIFEIKLYDQDGSVYGKQIEKLTQNQWQSVDLDFSEFTYWWGGDSELDLSKIVKIEFAVSKKEGGKGSLGIDQLSLSGYIGGKVEKKVEIKTLDTGEYTLLDNMNSVKGWTASYDDKGASCSLKSIKGKKKKAVGMKFNMGSGGWVYISKPVTKKILSMRKIKYFYKYKGKPNILEIKLQDKDGSFFGHKKEVNETSSWKDVEINLSDFSYWWGGDEQLDLKNLKSIDFALSKGSGGSGLLSIDEIQYQKKSQQITSDSSGVSRPMVVIDEFERLNPLSMYVPLKNDDSELKLATTRQYVREDNYSMELEYLLKTTKPSPSSVGAHWSADEPLDWRNIEELRIWVKGDGSANDFRVNIIDGSGETWTFQDSKVLLQKDWYQVKIPINQFRLAPWSKRNNKILDREEIQAYEISIAGREPVESSGKIYVDHFYAIGKDLVPALVTPQEVLAPITLMRPQGHFDIRGFALVEYKRLPASGSQFGSFARLFFEAKMKNFGLFTELTIGYKDFADAAAVNQDGNLVERRPVIESTSTKLYVNDLLPYINHITIGNLWVDFSDYTFSPFHTRSGEWGYKGFYGEGRVGQFSVHTFFLPHKYSSYTAGLRTDRIIFDTFMKFIYVDYHSRGKVLTDGTVIEGEIDKSKSGDLKTERLEDDNVFNIEMDKKLFKYFRLRGLYGENNRTKYAQGDMSDEFEPRFNYKLDKPQVKIGQIMKGELEILDFLFKEFRIYSNLRDIDNYYKPKYRRKPEEFDENISNQIGYNGRISQGYRGWLASVEYDYFKRKTDPTKYRQWFMWGIDRFNWHGFDIFFHQEFKRQDDTFERWLSDDLINKNEKITAYIIRVTYRFSAKANIIDEVRFEDILHPETGDEYFTSKLFFKIEYFMSGNNKVFLEYQFLRTGDPNWRSNTDDNFLKIVMEVNF